LFGNPQDGCKKLRLDIFKRAGADFISLIIFVFSRLSHKHLPPPWKIIFIDPYAISESIEPSNHVRKGRHRLSGLVRRSDWERVIPMPTKHHVMPTLFRELFFNKHPEIPAHSDKDTAETLDRLRETIDIERYRGICESMRAEGFERPRFATSRHDAFSVCIDKDGQLLFTTGKHRLALAKALGLSKIPVRVSARHIQWVRYRQAFYQRLVADRLNKIDKQHWKHPDLQDLIQRAG